MERRPGDMGFFTDGASDALGTNKRKASLTDTQDAKAQRLQAVIRGNTAREVQHAQRSKSPEPAAKRGGSIMPVPGEDPLYHFLHQQELQGRQADMQAGVGGDRQRRHFWSQGPLMDRAPTGALSLREDRTVQPGGPPSMRGHTQWDVLQAWYRGLTREASKTLPQL
jgi:hypothetical protein